MAYTVANDVSDSNCNYEKDSYDNKINIIDVMIVVIVLATTIVEI